MDSPTGGGAILSRMNDDLLSIGQFARLARLSIKQLRHYADLGLLRPAWVDPVTGYRYYRAEQARDALSIGLLRSLDVPLAAIGDVLAGQDLGLALTGVRDRLEEEVARRRRSLAALERILEHGLPSTEVTLQREEPQRVAVVRDVAESPQDIGRATAGCVTRLLASLKPAPPTRLTGLFPIDLDGSIPVAVAETLSEGQAAPAGVTTELLPGGLFARGTHTGPYDQISLTACALLAWCTERGHAPAGFLREIYVSNPAVTPPDQLVTQLLVPLEEPS